MKTLRIKDEDFEFLKKLSNELKTQTTDGCAQPVYWGVMETVTVPAHEGCGEPVISYNEGVYTLEEAIEYVNERIKDYDKGIQEEWDEIDKECIFDVADFMEYSLNEDLCSILYVEDKEEISRETGAFITKSACEEYIKRFGYNHNKPHTYGMVAYRNFELERLLKILQEFVFVEREKEAEWLSEACQVVLELDKGNEVCQEMKNEDCACGCDKVADEECVMRYLKKRTDIYNTATELEFDFRPKFKEGDILRGVNYEKRIVTIEIIGVVGDEYAYVEKGMDVEDRLYEFVDCIDHRYRKVEK